MSWQKSHWFLVPLTKPLKRETDGHGEVTMNIAATLDMAYSFQVTLGFAIATYSPPAYGKYKYPQWAVIMGWLIAATSLTPIPIYWIYKMYNTPGTLKEVFEPQNEKTGFLPMRKLRRRSAVQ